MEIFRHPGTNGHARSDDVARSGFLQSAVTDALTLIDMSSGVAGPAPLAEASLATTDAQVRQWLEVADVPATVRQAVMRLTDLPAPSHLPEGRMNALTLLHELRKRMVEWRRRAPNHVTSRSRFPLAPADATTLAHTPGQAPIDIRSKDYGPCRVVPTRRRCIWGVHYVDTMDTVVLDTLEMGDVPPAALAGREDFEDSAARLHELLDAGSVGAVA